MLFENVEGAVAIRVKSINVELFLEQVGVFDAGPSLIKVDIEVANVELTTLTNYDALTEVACDTGYIKDSDLELLKEWRFSPSTWGKKE